MEVILYSTGCPKCKVLKSKLDGKSIPYKAIEDIETMDALGIESVPVLCVDGKMMDFSSANSWVNDYNEG